MQFGFEPMNAQDAYAIAEWHYPVPYSFYDWTADPDDLAEFLDPSSWVRWYHAVRDEQGELAGFLRLQEERGTAVLGLGLRPDLTGQGHGLAFLLAALDFARKRFAVVTFQLAVATFNQRAIRVYERAGFSSGRVYLHKTNGGEYEFMEMSRDAEANR